MSVERTITRYKALPNLGVTAAAYIAKGDSMNVSHSTSTSPIANSPSPRSEGEAGRPGSSQIARSEQQRPTRIAEPASEAHAQQVISDFPDLYLGDSSSVHTEQASPGTRPNLPPGTLVRPRSSSDGRRAEASSLGTGSEADSAMHQVGGQASGKRKRNEASGASSSKISGQAGNPRSGVKKSRTAQGKAEAPTSLGEVSSSESSGQAEEPLRGIEKLSNELMLKIMELVPGGSIKNQYTNISAMIETNKKFQALVNLSGPLQRQRQVLPRLNMLRIQNPQGLGEPNMGYARRLNRADARLTASLNASSALRLIPDLTPEQTALAALNRSDSDFEKDLSQALEFQPQEVRKMVDELRQIQRGQRELHEDYAKRLKGIYPDLTPKEAALAAYGAAYSRLVDYLSRSLEFQLPEVRERIKTIREQFPKKWEETPYTYGYPLRLMKKGVTVEDAALADRGRVDPMVIDDLLMRASVEPH